jgi:hypothetical protein
MLAHRWLKPCAPLLLVLLTGLLPLPALAAPAKVFGWIEEALLEPGQIPLKIKLDTGALTSSMDAQNLQPFKRNGEKWLRFTVEFENARTGQLQSQVFERRVERSVKVRGAGGSDHRPVVSLQLCIGNQLYNEQFTLNNRSKMNYPVLLGRRTLEKLGLIDVSRTFLQPPKCS